MSLLFCSTIGCCPSLSGGTDGAGEPEAARRVRRDGWSIRVPQEQQPEGAGKGKTECWTGTEQVFAECCFCFGSCICVLHNLD